MNPFRLVAPAGAPLPVRAVVRSAFAAPPQGDPDEALRARLGIKHVFGVSSGRAALTIVLRAMQAGPRRREVVIPAYTCFSVPSAVVRAGLTIRLCDVDPKTLDMNFNALAGLDLARVLCIVPSSLYGLPGDLAGLEAIARTSGTFVVDDAAQCLGASQDGRACGTFGEAGFYSLGRGKGVTTMGGGVLVTRHDDLAKGIARELRAVPKPTGFQAATAIAGSLVYAGLLAPSRYWFVERIPFLGIGASHFKPDFPMARLSAYQRRLAVRMLAFVEPYNSIRRRYAEQLRAGIDDVEGIEIPLAARGANPVYQRFPMLTRDAAHRAQLLARLRAVGIAASASYPTTVEDIPGIARYLASDQEPCPGARSIATRILTLPTHPGVAPEDIERMVTAVRGTA